MKIKFLAAIMLVTLSACGSPERAQTSARERIARASLVCFDGLQYRYFDNSRGSSYSVVMDRNTDKPVHCTELPIRK
jgi:hypothetical protein